MPTEACCAALSICPTSATSPSASTQPATRLAESTRQLGDMLAEIYRRNPDRFRLFSPDETNSNRLGSVFDVSDRAFMERVDADDVKISADGRVMEVLSEHNCHGWLEGYTLTGRHGLFATYEAFAMVSASQTVQHSKWLEEADRLAWRARIPSFNVLLTSTAWRNDHNGFSHQGPGLIQVVLTHRGEVTRVYLPPDANCLLSVADHCLRSTSYVNLIVIDKQPQLQYLSIEEAARHCARGAGIWPWAGNDDGSTEPDIVLACAGDIVTMETVAAAQILRDRLPRLKTRVVNVVDLMGLIRPRDHPHGMSDTLFRELFTDAVDVVFAFHGFPGAVHQLVHGRPDADRFHVRGFIEQGTTTTPFDMTVKNQVSRYHLVMDALNNAGRTPPGHQTCSTGAKPSWRSIAPMSSNTSRTCPRSRTGPCRSVPEVQPAMSRFVRRGGRHLKRASTWRKVRDDQEMERAEQHRQDAGLDPRVGPALVGRHSVGGPRFPSRRTGQRQQSEMGRHHRGQLLRTSCLLPLGTPKIAKGLVVFGDYHPGSASEAV